MKQKENEAIKRLFTKAYEHRKLAFEEIDLQKKKSRKLPLRIAASMAFMFVTGWLIFQTKTAKEEALMPMELTIDTNELSSYNQVSLSDWEPLTNGLLTINNYENE